MPAFSLLLQMNEAKKSPKKKQANQASIIKYCSKVLDDGKMEDIFVKDDCPESYFFSAMIIATGLSGRHIKGNADNLSIQIKEKYDIKPKMDDLSQDWIVVCVGSIVIHLMTKDKRSEYDIESLITEFSRI